ncbi:hypothetical protein GMA12_10035 [Kocuria sediminis]|uniref:Uncharacterized protein n=1 Tax=Kocuria sediminis TaxID=1038857 RepID=A0A6N8GK16_9MICC|nr:hypothetical protein [Kocuria sediminis]MUN63476.1 hypothetical protein [Kocuria sediminis]
MPAALVLAAVQLGQAVLLRIEAGYLSVLLVLGAALCAAAAAGLRRRWDFTARFALVTLAALTLLAEGLLLVLGLPGVGHAVARVGLPATAGAALLGAVVLLVTLERDRRATLRAFP